MFETGNKPLVFEPLKFYCILFSVKKVVGVAFPDIQIHFLDILTNCHVEILKT